MNDEGGGMFKLVVCGSLPDDIVMVNRWFGFYRE